ncbi:MAG: RNA polymerase sigma factor [Trebonia sp.]
MTHATGTPGCGGPAYESERPTSGIAQARQVRGRGCVRLTGDWSVAEDVMAATFLEAWRGRQRVAEDGDSLRPWLLGIATNLARSHHRASHRHRKAIGRLPVLDGTPDFADDLTGRLDDAARIAALHRALENLREPELEVLALCVWSDLGYADAAEALGVPVGTVRSRLSRARTRLARLTDEELASRSRADQPKAPAKEARP